MCVYANHKPLYRVYTAHKIYLILILNVWISRVFWININYPQIQKIDIFY